MANFDQMEFRWVGKGALLRAVPAKRPVSVGTRSLSSGRPKAGPVGFAHPTTLPYDRNAL
jgi:hypothetical protein